MISRHSTLEDFIEHFFIILNALRNESNHKVQKVKVSPFREDSPQSHYSRLLTNYAAKFVLKQLKLTEKVSNIIETDGHYSLEMSEGHIAVTITACECMFNKAMVLPCRHIFALRSKLGEPLFDASICDKRWTSTYYRSTQRLFSSQSERPSLLVTISKKERRKLTQHEKFRQVSIVTSELASVASNASKTHFERRIELLKELVHYWKEGEEVSLIELDKGKH